MKNQKWVKCCFGVFSLILAVLFKCFKTCNQGRCGCHGSNYNSKRKPTFCVHSKVIVSFSRGISSSKVTVLGYGLLTTDARPLVEALNRQHFSVVVVDESHYLKSRNAARTKILVPIIQSAERAILLTGTPALGRPEEVTEIRSAGFLSCDMILSSLSGHESVIFKSVLYGTHEESV